MSEWSLMVQSLSLIEAAFNGVLMICVFFSCCRFWCHMLLAFSQSHKVVVVWSPVFNKWHATVWSLFFLKRTFEQWLKNKDNNKNSKPHILSLHRLKIQMLWTIGQIQYNNTLYMSPLSLQSDHVSILLNYKMPIQSSIMKPEDN